MTKQQEFRKQTEEAKFEAFSFMCKKVADLEAQIEEMKCCENCNNFQHRIDHRCNTKCKNLSEWEIKEK